MSGALLSGCAVQPQPPPPGRGSAPVESSAPPVITTATATATAAPAPAPSTAPAPSAPPPPLTSAFAPKGGAFAAFDPSSCKGPVPPRTEPACADVEPEAGSGDVRTRSPQNLANVRPACAVDALLVFEDSGPVRKKGKDEPAQVRELARSGQPCAGAGDKGACEQRLKSLAFPRDGGFVENGRRTFLVVARAGELKLVSTREQLSGLLGAVDSKQDAAALLWVEGWGGSCSKLQPQGTGFLLPALKLGFLCPPMLRGQGGGEQIRTLPDGYDKDGDYRVQVDGNGKLKVSYLGGADPKNASIACGRRPSGLALDAGSGPEVGAYLATSASLEAAAVMAFELLASELAAHDAPASLVERCRQAAEDERRHARLMLEAARRRGVEPLLPTPHTRPLPTLLELAQENVVEGCVRETWGALSAALQARTAQDPELAALYAGIAPDELAHAELSWDIHEWLAARTGSADQLEQLGELARAELLAEQADASPSVAALAGAPTQATACALIRALAA